MIRWCNCRDTRKYAYLTDIVDFPNSPVARQCLKKKITIPDLDGDAPFMPSAYDDHD